MNRDYFWFGLTMGFCAGMLVIVAALEFSGPSSRFANKGYFEAYKQFKQDKLEQSAPNSIKLRYETELLQQKYEDK